MGKSKKKPFGNSSKSRSKKKSGRRKRKSKKLSRRDDSVLYLDESDSSDSISMSASSSSEDDYTIRRSRPRRNGSKKKRRRRSYDSDTSGESLNIRKRKRSKRKSDYEGRKRKRMKKKRRRDGSVSSASSESCSTCRSSGSLDENEYDRKRGKDGRKDRDRRRKRSSDRSRSPSSPSQAEENDDFWPDEYRGETTARRLRSVITLVNDDYDDGKKEEMPCDRDDYPHCRSHDSKEKEDKKGEAVVSETRLEADAESNLSDEDRIYETKLSYDRFVPKDVDMEKSNQVSDASDDLESVLRKRALENLKRFRGGTQTNAEMPLEQKDKSGSDSKVQSSCDAEEVKFNSDKVDDSAGNQTIFSTLSGMNSESDQKFLQAGRDSGSTIRDFASPQDRLPAKERVTSTVFGYSGRPKLVRSVWRRDWLNASTKQAATSHESQDKLTSEGTDKDAREQTLTPTESGRWNLSNASTKQAATSHESGEKLRSEGRDKDTMEQTSTPNDGGRRELSNASTKQAATLHESREKLTSNGSDKNSREQASTPNDSGRCDGLSASPKQVATSHECLAEGSDKCASQQTLTPNHSGKDYKGNTDKSSISESSSSLPKQGSGSESSQKPQDEAKNGQFEQKTMSVMRGGEMVQVSYKVYIPQKTPALARRQLKR